MFQFISRKLMRWCVGPLLPALWVVNLLLVSHPVFRVLFILQNVFYLIAAIGSLLRRGGVQSRILFIPFYFVMVNAASLAAIVAYLRGDRLASWEKAETTRDPHESPERPARIQIVDGKKGCWYQGKRKGVENIERFT